MHYLSSVTTPLEIKNSLGKNLGKATGFFYKGEGNSCFLISNWHVVTGRDPGRPGHSKTASVPTTIDFFLHPVIETEGRRALMIKKMEKISISINSECGEGPTWLEHPDYRFKVDVVGLEIDVSKLSGLHWSFINSWPDNEERFMPSVMDNVFVIGFPYGLHGGTPALPLYKRGSICSEPSFPFGRLPCFLIDCTASSGMSGSPAIASHSGFWSSEKNINDHSIVGTVENFVGIYSGRLNQIFSEDDIPGAEATPSDIGIVWRKQVIDDILKNPQSGTALSALLA